MLKHLFLQRKQIVYVNTGKDETPSDTGLFDIDYKTTNTVLTDSYHYGGSHGCINMPVDITDEINENVEVGTKELVHK